MNTIWTTNGIARQMIEGICSSASIGAVWMILPVMTAMTAMTMTQLSTRLSRNRVHAESLLLVSRRQPPQTRLSQNWW